MATNQLLPYLRDGQDRLLITIGGGDGGIGKTTETLAFEAWCAARGLTATFVDADHEKASLYKRFSTNGVACEYVPLITDRNADDIKRQQAGDSLLKVIRRSPLTIVDLGAGADSQLFDWMDEVKFDVALVPRLKLRAIHWHMLSGEQESNVCVKTMLRHGFGNLEMVGCLNQAKGGTAAAWINGAADPALSGLSARDALIARGGHEVLMRKGPIAAFDLANRRSLTLTKLLEESDEAVMAGRYDANGDPLNPDGLPVLDDAMTFRLVGWLEEHFRDIDAVLAVR